MGDSAIASNRYLMSSFSIFRPKREQIDLMQWHIEQWDESGNIERVLAICANVSLGKAVFKSAVEQFPNKNITHRHGMRVIEEYGSEKNRTMRDIG
jgi:hypothetical protein